MDSSEPFDRCYGRSPHGKLEGKPRDTSAGRLGPGLVTDTQADMQLRREKEHSMTQADDQGIVTTIRGQDGASVLGPDNVPIGSQNPGAPLTDSGSLPNLKFPFAAAHNRLLPGGWAREVTVRDLPVATTLAGVNMRLKAGAYRELHWHKEAE